MAKFFSNPTASTTDGALVTGVAGKRVRVLAAAVSCGGTASTVTFNSKPAGAGTAIGPAFNNSIVLPYDPNGWVLSNSGEGLTVSTGTGSTTGILIDYDFVTA